MPNSARQMHTNWDYYHMSKNFESLCRALIVAQLTEWSLLTPADPRSNLVIGKLK